MTREHKLALIVGFSLILLVGVLISDHLSRARQAKIASVGTGETTSAALVPPGTRDPMKPLNDALAGAPAPKAETASPAAPGAPIVAEASPESAPAPVRITQGRTPRQDESEDPLGRAISEGTLVQMPDGKFDYRLPSAGVSKPETSPLAGASGTDAATSPLPKFEEAKASKPASTLAINESVKYHSVKKGETMFQIATDHYGTGRIWRELAKFNGVESKEGAVRVGMKLRIPSRDTLLGRATPVNSRATVSAPGSQPASKPAPGKRQEGTPIKPKIELATYTVKRGDTLGDISKKTLGTSKRWQEFVDLNKLDDEDHIPAGTVLKIPAMRG